MNIHIQKATLSDLEALVPLFDGYRVFYAQATDPAAARAFLRDRLQRDDSVIFFAAATGAPCGFAQLYPSFSSVSMKRLWILNDLYVDSAFRNQGVASELMATAETWARKTDAKGLLLQTARDNTNAQKLYEKRRWVRDDATYYYEFSV